MLSESHTAMSSRKRQKVEAEAEAKKQAPHVQTGDDVEVREAGELSYYGGMPSGCGQQPCLRGQ